MYEVRFENPGKREVYYFPYEGNGLQYELQAFLREIQSNQKEYDRKKMISTAFADIMEQFTAYKKSKKEWIISGGKDAAV